MAKLGTPITETALLFTAYYQAEGPLLFRCQLQLNSNLGSGNFADLSGISWSHQRSPHRREMDESSGMCTYIASMLFTALLSCGSHCWDGCLITAC